MGVEIEEHIKVFTAAEIDVEVDIEMNVDQSRSRRNTHRRKHINLSNNAQTWLLHAPDWASLRKRLAGPSSA